MESDFAGASHLSADHPLLQQAQEALTFQLEERKLYLQEQLREKVQGLKDAKQRREDLVGEESRLLQKERDTVDAFRDELNTVSNALKRVSAKSHEQKSEIAVKQRWTHAADQSARRLQRETAEQEAAAEALQRQVDFQKAQLALFREQRAAQEGDTAAARKMLAQAAVDMEGVQAELRGRRQQWQSSLLGLQHRDDALKGMEEAARKQAEQQKAVDVELAGCSRDVRKAAARTEQTVIVVERQQGEAAMLSDSSSALRGRQGMLQDTLGRLATSLTDTEQSIRAEHADAKSLADAQVVADRTAAAAQQQLQETTEQVLLQLSTHAQADKRGQQVAVEVKRVRQRIQEQEAIAEALREKGTLIEADVATAEARNGRHADTLSAAEAELKVGEAAVERTEATLKKCADEIERKTREQDILNRKLEKILAAVPPGEDAGPLEATIANLSREIAQRTEEGHALQLQWVTLQRELLALAASNGAASEQLAKDTSTYAVMQHRLSRLEHQNQVEAKSLADLDKAMERQRADMSRVNAMLAETTEAHVELVSETFGLRSAVNNQIKDMEEEQARMRCEIEAVRSDKHTAVADAVEAQRKVLEWERRIQLDREMALALDPAVGNEEAAALACEVGRLKTREAEVRQARAQKHAELQRAVERREVVELRGLACEDKRAAANIEHRQQTMLAALERTLAEVTKNSETVQARVSELTAQQGQMESQAEEIASRCGQLCAHEEALRSDIAAVTDQKHQALILTSRAQRVAKWYEEAAAGKLTPHTGPELLQAKVTRATARHQKIQGILRELSTAHPEVSPGMERILLSSVPVAC
ncbi:hypothetical protein WJX75_003675 [Coccomyxa subellipsoidea]|uniref:Uncharacterized protein n=1 Tax=Coccomyxa subellipsoidea TaxID=248742 RepID=A0ABR2YTP3_9CHLO